MRHNQRGIHIRSELRTLHILILVSYIYLSLGPESQKKSKLSDFAPPPPPV